MVAFAFIAFLLVILGVFATANIGGSRVQKWADENAFELISCDYRVLDRGPFFWRTRRGEAVFRVKIRNEDGVVQSGYVRCGTGWWSRPVAVVWDE